MSDIRNLGKKAVIIRLGEGMTGDRKRKNGKKTSFWVRLIEAFLFLLFLPVIIPLWFLYWVIKFSCLVIKKLLKAASQPPVYSLDQIDQMSGQEFEICMMDIYERLGYSVKHTPLSGDQGADFILTSKKGVKIAIQCKRYSDKVSNSAVQEVVASKGFYKCTEGVVVTNNYFTPSAKQLATANKIELIDRMDLIKIINSISKQPTNNVSQAAQKEQKTKTNPILINTVFSDPHVQSVRDPDYEWRQYVQRYFSLLKTDLDNTKNAILNLDYDTLTKLVKDTQNAMDENKQYNISLKYKDANKEWMAALQEFNNAGTYTILISDEEKTNDLNNPETCAKLQKLIDSGNAHMDMVNVYLNYTKENKLT